MFYTIQNIESSIVTVGTINGGTWWPQVAGLYTIDLSVSIQPNSQIFVYFFQVGSTFVFLQSDPPSAGQTSISFKTILNCQPGDFVQLGTFSPLESESQLNNVKSIIRIAEGQV